MAVDTSLSERKLTILKAIIQNYLETGEPVGSRTLSKYTDLNGDEYELCDDGIVSD